MAPVSESTRTQAGQRVSAPGVRRRLPELKKPLILAAGAALFAAAHLLPLPEPAMDPAGVSFALTAQGKAALGLFLLALVWWTAEVVPIGVTGAAVVAIQAIFMIRPARAALTDFMDPAVWFITGSLIMGMAFTKTGLARRAAYRTLVLVGENTSVILLGCLLLTAGLTLVMAHTAVAATVYPLFMAVHALYSEGNQPTRFGKALFIGMALAAGAGSVITFLGSARAVIAAGFYAEMAGRRVGFLEISFYMFPVGAIMVALAWALVMVLWPPEKKVVAGLRERARRLHASLGPFSRREALALAVIAAAVAVLSLQSVVPSLRAVDQSAILVAAAVMFFVLGVLNLDDLEGTPLNIIFLFGGAMSLGHCLWQTGAARWVGVSLLGLFTPNPWHVFVLSVVLTVLLMTNLVLNVAVIAVSLPVAFVVAPYVGVSTEAMFCAVLAAAGMPFMTLLGAAPNAIAYGSGQFTQREFLRAGLPASAALVLLLGAFVWFVWPAMGMPVIAGKF
ncbi:MAG: SLC13/DASS family transporter [Deltaproteobacteria bacterium]|nr:SLC13/DASS family transporter [Deltaproteobacteria bacterium]